MGGVGARSLVCGRASAAVAGAAVRPNKVSMKLAIEIPRNDAISFSNLSFCGFAAMARTTNFLPCRKEKTHHGAHSAALLHPKFQIPNSRRYGEDEFSGGESLHAAKKLTFSSARPLPAATKSFQHRGRGEELTKNTEEELRAWFIFSVRSVFCFL